MKLSFIHSLNTAFLLLLSSCVAYMENQAARKGQTGDPQQGGFFGFSEQLSDQRIADLDRTRSNEQSRYEMKKNEEAQLRRQLAEAEQKMNSAATTEAREMAQRDINRISKQILAISSN